MLLQRSNNQITITINSSLDSFGIQRVIDYLKYLETTSKSKATQKDADALAEKVNSDWWKKNKKRFVK